MDEMRRLKHSQVAQQLLLAGDVMLIKLLDYGLHFCRGIMCVQSDRGKSSVMYNDG